MIRSILYMILTLVLLNNNLACAQQGTKINNCVVIHHHLQVHGMFSVFMIIIGALNAYDQGGFSGLHVDLPNGRYFDLEKGLNWWEYYFEPIQLGNQNLPKHTPPIYDVVQLAISSFTIPRQKASQILEKYIKVKEHIQEKVDAFTEKNFKNHFIIGIHHRGTDKRIEFNLIPYEKNYEALCAQIENLTDSEKERLKVYIATDDYYFLQYMIERIPSVIYGDFVRSVNGIPLHDPYQNGYSNNYQRGEEALLECLLLSKCDVLIRPESNLSIAAGLFNPKMAVVSLHNGIAPNSQWAVQYDELQKMNQ